MREAAALRRSVGARADPNASRFCSTGERGRCYTARMCPTGVHREPVELSSVASTEGRWLALVPVVASAIVYYPITRNYFREDDFVNLYFIHNYSLQRFLITVWAGHALVVRNIIWWILHAFVGVRPEPYFNLAFLTHLAAVGVLFEAFRRLSRDAIAACVTACLWGTAAVHQEAIGWFSVYGQLLAVVVLAWMLLRLADVRSGGAFGARSVVVCGVLVLVVATSFGVGLGIAFGLPVIVAVLLPPSPNRRRVIAAFAVIAVLALLLYSSLIRLSWALYGPFPYLSIFAAFGYPTALVKFFALLAANGIVALHAGPFTGYFAELGKAWWVLISVWIALVLTISIRVPISDRRVIGAGLLLAAACYAAIAMGRAPFFAKGIGFEREARYQYAATVGFALVDVVIVAWAGARVRLPAVFQLATAVAVGAVLAICERRFAPPINDHTNERRETESVIATIHSLVANSPPGSDVYIENKRFFAVGPVIGTAGMPLFPGWAAVFATFFPDDTVDGRRVYFISDPAIVRAGKQGRRSERLLVTRR